MCVCDSGVDVGVTESVTECAFFAQKVAGKGEERRHDEKKIGLGKAMQDINKVR